MARGVLWLSNETGAQGFSIITLRLPSFVTLNRQDSSDVVGDTVTESDFTDLEEHDDEAPEYR